MSQLPQVPANWDTFGNAFSRWFGRSMLKLMGWQIEGELPQQSKLMFAVAPHTSNIDFFIGLFVMFAIGFKVHWLGKHSIFIFPIKRLMISWGGIPVYRHAPRGFVDQVADQFRSHERLHIAIAPEGTRSKVGKFKTGFLRIAKAADIPVFRVGFDYGRKTVVFGDLFYPTNNTEADERACYEYFKRFNGKFSDNY